MKKEYNIDQNSYERFKQYSKQEVNQLLRNTYLEGYTDGKQYATERMPKDGKKAFIVQLGTDICDMLDRERMRGITDKTKDRFKKLIIAHLSTYATKEEGNE